MTDEAGLIRYRDLGGIAARVADSALLALVVSGLIWALGLHSLLGFAFFGEQFLALFLGFALVATFLLVPGRRRAVAVTWYDWLLAALAAGAALAMAARYPAMAYNLSSTEVDRLLLAGIGLLLILEATRRLFGWALVIIALTFCLYAAFADLFPGLLYGRARTPERIVTYVYLDSNGVFGLALGVAATVVVCFILFGACLSKVGGEDFFTDIARALMGARRGGAAKISILSSILFGTVSGSAVANVVVGGHITIGMMKRSGYPAHQAAAIEAASSTGGQIMPPVMGITAFLIAENLDMPYGEVALAALVPALLYYLALFVQADLFAARHGLLGEPRAELPRVRDVMRRGWVFLAPLGVLTWLLVFESARAEYAGVIAAAATLALPAIYSRDHLHWRRLRDIVLVAGRGMLDITVVCALAGIVMGALNLSGVLFKLTLLLSQVSFGHVLVLLAMVAIISTVLGMGLPSLVIYVLLAVLLAPALVEAGVTPIGAHLFIFYFGMLSMITPPVCLATFAAASIAKSKVWPTGWAAMKLGVVAYILPFAFALHPSLLLIGRWDEVVLACASAVISVVALSAGLVGYGLAPLAPWRRILAVAGGVALVWPPANAILAVVNVAGLAAALVALWPAKGAARAG